MNDNKKMDAGFLNEDCPEMEKPLSTNVATEDGETFASIAKINRLKEGKEINWANKYQPKALKDFICHKEKAEMLCSLVRSEQPGHYIIEGPPGVGKRTMAQALLREDIGLDITEIREEFKSFHLKLKGAFEEGEAICCIHLKVKISSQHIEVNLEDLKEYAEEAVLELFKETSSGLVHQQNLQGDHSNDKAIVLYKAEKLTIDTQLNIQSFLETCRGHYKVIFCCTNLSQLLHLTSLCTAIQLLPPSDKEIIEVLDFISEQEDIELPPQLAQDIAEKSKSCIQQAIRSFEATWQSKVPVKNLELPTPKEDDKLGSNCPFEDGQLIMTVWKKELAMMAKSIIEEQSPKRLYVIRQKLIIMFQHNVSPDFIFKTLVEELKNHFDDRIKKQIEFFYHEYTTENLISRFVGDTCKKTKNSASGLLRIEEFIAKFMSIYKDCNMERKRELMCVQGPSKFPMEILP